ncbi:hypothetical protein MKZ38_006516 [Zalerion maritima]|uniref:Uncharacterized protein n=1 Tax=Zalerion maritima TaxID=339359 RepID=A0AAD5RYS8_9PEZI|nr:hypothetical protein MKZ38_006516 [Zalerion maritima]
MPARGSPLRQQVPQRSSNRSYHASTSYPHHQLSTPNTHSNTLSPSINTPTRSENTENTASNQPLPTTTGSYPAPGLPGSAGNPPATHPYGSANPRILSVLVPDPRKVLEKLHLEGSSEVHALPTSLLYSRYETAVRDTASAFNSSGAELVRIRNGNGGLSSISSAPPRPYYYARDSRQRGSVLQILRTLVNQGEARKASNLAGHASQVSSQDHDQGTNETTIDETTQYGTNGKSQTVVVERELHMSPPATSEPPETLELKVVSQTLVHAPSGSSGAMEVGEPTAGHVENAATTPKNDGSHQGTHLTPRVSPQEGIDRYFMHRTPSGYKLGEYFFSPIRERFDWADECEESAECDELLESDQPGPATERTPVRY